MSSRYNLIQLRGVSREPSGTLCVRVRFKSRVFTIPGVPENIIRCAIGESDLAYLLSDDAADDEGQCFKLTNSEFDDCVAHGAALLEQ